MTRPHDFLKYARPDEVAETWDGVYSSPCGLYEALWDLVPAEEAFDREDCGPHDVVGLGCVAEVWDRLTNEQQVALNELAAKRSAWIDSMTGGSV